ncbi:hypothetical protein B0H19DRAFT_1272752 [Mycena capillaripes]|nr:hypothetical protein B0H19DRAFT_1272752 [Mycena capillaripes]
MSVYVDGNLVSSVSHSSASRTVVDDSCTRELRLPHAQRILLTTTVAGYGIFSSLVDVEFRKNTGTQLVLGGEHIPAIFIFLMYSSALSLFACLYTHLLGMAVYLDGNLVPAYGFSDDPRTILLLIKVIPTYESLIFAGHTLGNGVHARIFLSDDQRSLPVNPYPNSPMSVGTAPVSLSPGNGGRYMENPPPLEMDRLRSEGCVADGMDGQFYARFCANIIMLLLLSKCVLFHIPEAD